MAGETTTPAGQKPADGSTTTTSPATVPGSTTDAPATQSQTQQQAATTVTPKDAPKEPVKPATQAKLQIKWHDSLKDNQKLIERFNAKAEKLGFTQEQAQAMAEDVATEAQALEASYQKHVADDEAALKADKEFGGVKFEQTVKDAQSALSQFFGEEASKLLMAFGLHKSPALVKGLARIRAAIAEDSVGDKKKAAPQPINDRDAQLKKMFPNSQAMFEQGA